MAAPSADPTRAARPAAAVLLLASAALAALTWDVTHGGPVSALDHRIAAWLTGHLGPAVTPALHELLRLVSVLHKPRVIAAVTIVAALLALALRRRADALLVLLAVPLGSVVNHLLKHTLQRPRPGLAATPGLPTDFAFPSGHVASATLLYGVMALLAVRHSRSPAVRIAAAPAAVLIVTLVGASRVVLGAHHPSDVVGGALVGLAWIALCLLAIGRFRRRTAPERDFRG